MSRPRSIQCPIETLESGGSGVENEPPAALGRLCQGLCRNSQRCGR